MTTSECREKLRNEPLALQKYHEDMLGDLAEDENALTEDEWPFYNWIEDLMDEYDSYAYSVMMPEWEAEERRKQFRLVK